MPERLAPLKSEKLLKLLYKLGFTPVRQKGSHIFLRHGDGRVTSVPFHKGEDVGRGLLRKIISEIRLTREEFLKELEEL